MFPQNILLMEKCAYKTYDLINVQIRLQLNRF